MPTLSRHGLSESDPSFKVFHELMTKRVKKILLVSTPYDAFIIEEDGRLAERITHKYKGLNLSSPPKFTWVSTIEEAFVALSCKKFDLVITIPRLDNGNPYFPAMEIKKKFHNIPVFLLAHEISNTLLDPLHPDRSATDKIFVWRGDTDLLLAIIKSVEDRMNVAHDTQRARIRVIIMVEDSPYYCSSILPLLYREIMMQTQTVMEESLNAEHRILKMRARPKILVAENFEEAINLYKQYAPYLLCVISDVSFPRKGKRDDHAGSSLLATIKEENPDIPLLMLSSTEANLEKALKIPAFFLNKNSPFLHRDIRPFFNHYLGFGDFIFYLPDGTETAQASNLRTMEKVLPSVPDESIYFHAKRNDFSTWLMARSEIELASKLRALKVEDFSSAHEIKDYLISSIQDKRKKRQKGIVADFSPERLDSVNDFLKIGRGSLGGKARGLAFAFKLLEQHPELQEKFPDVTIHVPKTLAISTDIFDYFVGKNNLKTLFDSDLSDKEIEKIFIEASFPEWLSHDLELLLEQVKCPLAVRSSSLLEDSQRRPYAGIYHTDMISNNHPDLSVRLGQLIKAIKRVYASTYMEAPSSFAKCTLQRIEEEKMGVVIQQIIGKQYGDYFYPAVSGVAQSYNFYPVSYMKPEEGIAHIATGLGKTVMEGGKTLRFSPKYPQFLPQFSTVDDILENSQRYFYALKIADGSTILETTDAATLEKLDIDDFRGHHSIQQLASTYIPEDHRIRDSVQKKGHLVLTFASILKYKLFPLPEILSEILKIGQKGMGCPVEIEFAVNLPVHEGQKPEFALLQIRPMGLGQFDLKVEIKDKEITNAFCISTKALGHGQILDIADIVFVKPDTFDPARTIDMVGDLNKINGMLVRQNRKYLLIGPGRWGSADRWLGIPVRWNDISGAGSIIETLTEKLRAEPSQGSHFFHNITSLGISYITVSKDGTDFIDWDWLHSLSAETETNFFRHVKLSRPLTIKIDGKKSYAILTK